MPIQDNSLILIIEKMPITDIFYRNKERISYPSVRGIVKPGQDRKLFLNMLYLTRLNSVP
jgi:hypothetical protein